MISLSKVYKSNQLHIGEIKEIRPKTKNSLNATEFPSEKNATASDSDHENSENHQQMDDYLEQVENEAKEIIAAAEKEAADLLEKTYRESNEKMEQSRKEGYHQGYQAGLEDGQETGYREMAALIDEAAKLKQEAYDKRNELTIKLEMDTVQLVIQTVRRVLQLELQDNQELIFTLIEEGLRKCNYTENLIVHVSEMDYDLVYAYQNRIYLMSEGIYDIEVKSDPSMSPGSVLIETASGQIDAGIETQIRQIETAFKDLLNDGGESA